ncbi:tripartite motif-containing protein 16 [Astyanax mexicanus]|uniref:tripartite motif-containing protein 16 n=1 Tax=Astyanax mexicanus TaxID=7994 RepID=UPI0020CB5982|nr:tripartite motif-containing protein 16 [Astyanax mexicanus]
MKLDTPVFPYIIRMRKLFCFYSSVQGNRDFIPFHLLLALLLCDCLSSTSEYSCRNMASFRSMDQDHFSCPICLDVLNNPVTTACGHSFCQACIASCWDEEDHKGIYSCPQCRHTFTPRPVLHKNVMIAEMMEKLKVSIPAKSAKPVIAPPVPSLAGPEDVECDFCTGRKHKAVQSCLVCLASYCEAHLQPHYQSPAFKKHKLVKASRRLQEQICSQHDKLLEVYCRTDQQCICMLCTTDEHKGHDILSASVERAEKQKKLEWTRRESQKKIQERQVELQELRGSLESYKRSAQEAVKDSDEIFTKLIVSIERRRSEVRQMIRDQEKAAVSRAEEHLKKLEQEIMELKKRSADLEQLSFTEDHIHFLQNLQSLSTTSGSTGLNTISFSLFQSFEGVVVSVSQLAETVEEHCEEELKKIADEVNKIKIILPSDPTRRNDFLEYSCELTLDPNTVNTVLCLSEGNTVVTNTNTVQPYPDHPLRFGYWPQMLCKEGFCGRCYWEVEWEGSDGVFMAVSYESISREGRAAEAVFGCNNQSWRLSCSPARYSFWHNNKETRIRRQPNSFRIGVYLDHAAGSLAFYSISDIMTLLHRVQTTFTRPLYAGFLVHPGSKITLTCLRT